MSCWLYLKRSCSGSSFLKPAACKSLVGWQFGSVLVLGLADLTSNLVHSAVEELRRSWAQRRRASSPEPSNGPRLGPVQDASEWRAGSSSSAGPSRPSCGTHTPVSAPSTSPRGCGSPADVCAAAWAVLDELKPPFGSHSQENSNTDEEDGSTAHRHAGRKADRQGQKTKDVPSTSSHFRRELEEARERARRVGCRWDPLSKEHPSSLCLAVMYALLSCVD